MKGMSQMRPGSRKATAVTAVSLLLAGVLLGILVTSGEGVASVEYPRADGEPTVLTAQAVPPYILRWSGSLWAIFGVAMGLALVSLIGQTRLLNWFSSNFRRAVLFAGLSWTCYEFSVLIFSSGALWLYAGVPSTVGAAIGVAAIEREWRWGFVFGVGVGVAFLLGVWQSSFCAAFPQCLGDIHPEISLERASAGVAGLGVVGSVLALSSNAIVPRKTARRLRLVRDAPGERGSRSGRRSGRAGAGWMARDVQCQNCLRNNAVLVSRSSSEERGERFSCDFCGSAIPTEYVADARVPKVVVSAIGFRGHGKTVYFASLFHSLNLLPQAWPGFFTYPYDDQSLRTVRNQVQSLRYGTLPPPSPREFPVPTVLKFGRVPGFGDRTFIFFDTSGEVYTQLGSLGAQENFVTHSPTAMFIFSPDNLDYDTQMHDLLSIYTRGISEHGGDTRNQHLVVVLSKGDRLEERLAEYPGVWSYLRDGSLGQLMPRDFLGKLPMDRLHYYSMSHYFRRMRKISRELRGFLRSDVRSMQSLNLAEARFKSVEYCIVSALGAEPEGDKLVESVTPKRIMDPLLWLAIKSGGGRHVI